MEINQDLIKNPFQNMPNDLGLITKIQKGFEMKYMYVPKDKSEKNNPEIRDIVVEWTNGKLNGFRSKEDAERYINQVCKKTAPDMDYSISSCIIRR